MSFHLGLTFVVICVILKEDDFRRKGPSKENKKEPLVGLSLLLDRNQIPIGMKMYSGNESEKSVLRDVINRLKSQNNVTGKTIHVADKGLNCAQNIAFSKKNGDGYLFSKSVKGLPETEKVWVLLDQGFKDVKDENGKHCTATIFRFIRDFKVTQAETKYINTATSTRFINELSEKLRLPLTNYFLAETQIKSILNHKL